MLLRCKKGPARVGQVDDFAFLLSELLRMSPFTFRVTQVLQGSLVSWGIQANR